MNRPQIALVAARYAPAVGGVERTVEMLARGLLARGFGVEVLTTDPGGTLPRLEMRDGVVVRRFPTIAGDAVYFVSPQLGEWLARNAAQFALVHAHSYHTPLAFQAAVACRRAGVPLVLSPYYHGGGHSALRNALHVPYRPVGAWALRQAKRLVCISQTERALLQRHIGQLPPSVVAPCGVDLEPALAGLPRPPLNDRSLVLAVGRLERYKQTDRLVTALPHLPAAYHGVVIGNGPLRPRLAALGNELGLGERLRLLEHVPRSDLCDWYWSADVFVSMSQHESFGLTVLEAAGHGAAVVASDIAAHREISGYLPMGRVTLVPPDCTPIELARAIDRAARGRTLNAASGLPTWDAMVDAVATCYGEVLDEAKSLVAA
jgi:glycosyltransferase involved in cell wall biosynthesis